MPFKKGRKKTGGIKKGQKHSRTKLKENLGLREPTTAKDFWKI